MTTQASTQLGESTSINHSRWNNHLAWFSSRNAIYFFDARAMQWVCVIFLKEADKKIVEVNDVVSETIKENDVNKEELNWDDVDQVDLVGLDIGYGLIPLVNPETGGQLYLESRELEKNYSPNYSLVQPIRIRDNLDLEPDVYNIVMNGVIRGKGEQNRTRTCNKLGASSRLIRRNSNKRACIWIRCSLDRSGTKRLCPDTWLYSSGSCNSNCNSLKYAT